MTGVSPIYRWLNIPPYEIVEKGFSRARILVFIEEIADNFRISYKGKEIYVYGFDDERTYYTRIKLWFKVKKVKYMVKNGILTIDVKGRRLLCFLPF